LGDPKQLADLALVFARQVQLRHLLAALIDDFFGVERHRCMLV
jgi:hypothetical protein